MWLYCPHLNALGELLEDELQNSGKEKQELLKKLRRFRTAKASIILAGATGDECSIPPVALSF